MGICVVYRALYGDDFVAHSINSVLPHVDRVVVVYAGKPFANVEACHYKDKVYPCPVMFDDMLERIPKDPKVSVIEHYYPTPRNQWTNIINELVAPKWGMPETAIFMHVCMVWRQDEIIAALEQFKRERFRYANTRQIETWRGFDWRIPERKRAGAGFWDLRMIDRMPPTELDAWRGSVARVPLLDAQVHNLRYSQNPNIMFWRHAVVSEYVRKTGDSIPNPDWFEDKWLNWNPATKNIEHAKNWTHTVPKAAPYDVDELPEDIYRDLSKLRAQTSNDAWKGFPRCVSE